MALVHSWRRSAGPPADRRHQEVEADGLLIRRSPFSFSSVREVAACWPRDTAVRWVGGGSLDDRAYRDLERALTPATT